MLQRCLIHRSAVSRGVVASTSSYQAANSVSHSAKQTTRTDGKKNQKRHPKFKQEKKSEQQIREPTLEDLVTPVKLDFYSDPVAENPGLEIAGSISKQDINKALMQFSAVPEIRQFSAAQNITDKLFHKSFVEFRAYCIETDPLPADLHVKLHDIIHGNGRVEDLVPFFVEHARRVFPHLECLDDLKKICDLSQPHTWYPEARAVDRRIIFHAGPTNSGKTHNALVRFSDSESGVFCGPLKLLAMEVYYKTNGMGVPCDMITGDDRKYGYAERSVDGENKHIACTIEMLDATVPFEVCVIDEIQMIRDVNRGWAWTRALLGSCAEEIHLCGEPAAIPVIQEILLPIGENLIVHEYERKSPLHLSTHALKGFQHLEDGDCVVCFSKKDIFDVSKRVERTNREVAVIYGSLPPATKLAQAARFNDPENSCKVMVATDAIGMGLNMHIKRIIFYSLLKPRHLERFEKVGDHKRPAGVSSASLANNLVIEPIQTYEALQIGGRAGRFGTDFSTGTVTCFHKDDLPLLEKIWKRPVDDIQRAGLRPTFDQIEMFAYYLPHASLKNIFDIFLKLTSMDDGKYFMCGLEDTIFIAEMIEHIPLPLKVRYTFCLAPVNKNVPASCAMFLKYVRRFSRNDPITASWFCNEVGWPLRQPNNIKELNQLEGIFDIMDVYLWLGYRFTDMFPDQDDMRVLQKELDEIIQNGVHNIKELIKNQEVPKSTGGDSGEEARRAKAKSEEVKLVLQLIQEKLDANSKGTIDLNDVAKLINDINSSKRDESAVEDSSLPSTSTSPTIVTLPSSTTLANNPAAPLSSTNFIKNINNNSNNNRKQQKGTNKNKALPPAVAAAAAVTANPGFPLTADVQHALVSNGVLTNGEMQDLKVKYHSKHSNRVPPARQRQQQQHRQSTTKKTK